MADDLINQCASLKINSEEEEVIDIGEIETNGEELRVSLMLIGRLLTDRGINVEAFKRTITQSWALKGRVIIRCIGRGKPLWFQFLHWKDKERVMMGRPWCFEHNLLILNEISRGEQSRDVNLNFSPFWVRIKDLSFDCRTNSHVNMIASKLGDVIEIEEDSVAICKSRRVKVMLDVQKPLKRYQTLRTKEGNVIRINLKYERLPFFCFSCGTMGHSERDCLLVSDDSNEQGHGWGAWLKASPMKGKN
ncbi:uncharacterized protein LOC110739484 [Chenopodium quinoa]|uniref:uncharacterized protein LOC110739484 n=1 Tax=Chenopodium quinoa TaxID=63459 RepID=UPI000B76BA5B|nr:uncharacterized protein LOC110739484 [Chenopodium quinoa]